MPKYSIYVTGAVDDYDDPHGPLIEDLSEKYPAVDWINPYDLNEFDMGDDGVYEEPEKIVEPAIGSLDTIDGMIVQWDDDAFLVGTVIEIWEAYKRNVPVAIVYDGWRDHLSPWLLYAHLGTYESTDTAVKVLLMLFDEDGVL